jgi:hypothetical protein
MDNIKKISFSLDYKKEKVVFNRRIQNKRKMSLKEFAITILQIEPVSTEVIAVYIGKLGFEAYKNKSKFNIEILKKTKTGIKGIIEIKEN